MVVVVGENAYGHHRLLVRFVARAGDFGQQFVVADTGRACEPVCSVFKECACMYVCVYVCSGGDGGVRALATLASSLLLLMPAEHVNLCVHVVCVCIFVYVWCGELFVACVSICVYMHVRLCVHLCCGVVRICV